MKKLRLTSFNTIVGEDFNEMFVDKFFEIMDTRLGDNYAIYYEEYNNRFKVIFDGVKYYLTLDKITMDNYAFGNYNNFTLKLKRLIDRVQGIEQEKDDEEEIALRKEQIIEDAEKGLIPNNEAREVYLLYLKNSKKFSFSKIKSYFSNLIDDFKSSYNLVDNWILNTNIWPFDRMCEGREYFGYCAIVSFFIVEFLTIGLPFAAEVVSGQFNYKWLYWFLLSLLPQTTYLVPVIKFLGFQAMMRYERLIAFIETKKLSNYKIKQLTEELKIGRIQSNTYDSFDKTLPEPPKEQKNPLEDNILKKLDDIVERLKYINLADRRALFDEVKDISSEYVSRLENIRDQDLEGNIKLCEDNYFRLNTDILSRIDSLERRMYQIRMNDVDSENINKQYLTLINKIDTYYEEDKVIGGERLPRTKKQSENR